MPATCALIFFPSFFFFNDTATTEIYTLSLHDALPICRTKPAVHWLGLLRDAGVPCGRSEEHTSELQSHVNLVCRLLLEKKNKKICAINQTLKMQRRNLERTSCITVICDPSCFFHGNG